MIPARFNREPIRAIVINPSREGPGYIVGSLDRTGGTSTWIDPPMPCANLAQAWFVARSIRQRTGLPILDKNDAPTPTSAPTGGLAA